MENKQTELEEKIMNAFRKLSVEQRRDIVEKLENGTLFDDLPKGTVTPAGFQCGTDDPKE